MNNEIRNPTTEEWEKFKTEPSLSVEDVRKILSEGIKSIRKNRRKLRFKCDFSGLVDMDRRARVLSIAATQLQTRAWKLHIQRTAPEALKEAQP